MNLPGIQHIVEPSSEGRKSTFGSIEPAAVERALKLKERFEEGRKARLKIGQPAGEEVGSAA